MVTSHSACTYLVVVAASEEGLYHYLKARFDADAGTQVIIDRRRRGDVLSGPADRQAAERRSSQSVEILSSQRVAVIRLSVGAGEDRVRVNEPAGTGGAASMEGIEALEDRQRVDRWLEESQYLIGRLFPAYLDDRDRVRSRLDVVEQDKENRPYKGTIRFKIITTMKDADGAETNDRLDKQFNYEYDTKEKRWLIMAGR